MKLHLGADPSSCLCFQFDFVGSVDGDGRGEWGEGGGDVGKLYIIARSLQKGTSCIFSDRTCS